MYKIQTFNAIAQQGLDQLTKASFEVGPDINHPDAIVLRSHNLHEFDFPSSVRAVGRAGAGVNNIPVEQLTEQGIPVFNTPGANANAVKELTIAGMLMACRHIAQAWEFAKQLTDLGTDDEAISKAVESSKKQFAGYELASKTLGVIGLGAIGVSVANAAIALGMKVIGFDPMIRVEQAWRLSPQSKQAASMDEVIEQADFLTVHVPLIDATRNLLDKKQIQAMKSGAVLLNLARHGIINEQAVCDALDAGHLGVYVCDFPNSQLLGRQDVINLPHLGASTKEAEENCAIMVAEQIRDYLTDGTIRFSVNYPDVMMRRSSEHRLAIANRNVPNMVGQISTILANADINIHNLINQSKGNIAYTLIDVNNPIPDEVLESIRNIKGVLTAHYLLAVS